MTTTTADYKLKLLVGELQFQMAILATKLEEAQARILELEKSAAEAPAAKATPLKSVPKDG